MDRVESLFLTVSENHRKRAYPEYIQAMSAPYQRAGGMIAAYEGVILGGGDKLFGLEALDLRKKALERQQAKAQAEKDGKGKGPGKKSPSPAR